MSRGVLLAGAAYVVWGLLPIFWKMLAHIDAMETTAHRVLWSALLLVAVLAVRRNWGPFARALCDRRVLATFALSAALLMLNWLAYLWAIQQDNIVETSLGYFINPLVNVVLGVVFLSERMRAGQWAAVAIAAAGVLYLTISYGTLPWIALTLAVTFAFYGLIRKTAQLNSLDGLTVEIAILAVPMAGYLIWLTWAGGGSSAPFDTLTWLLLAGTGLTTTLPLLLFSAGARRVSMSVLGLLQYIAPTMAFFIGTLMYGEPFSRQQLIGFSFIWVALALYTVEGMLERRRYLNGVVSPSRV